MRSLNPRARQRRNGAGGHTDQRRTAQQVGGSIGTALLSTIAASAATAFAAGSQDPAVLAEAAVHSYTTAFWWSAAVFGIGAVISFALLSPGTRTAHERLGEPAMAH